MMVSPARYPTPEREPIDVMFVHAWGAIMAGGEVWIRNLAGHLKNEQVNITAVLGIQGPLFEVLRDMQVETQVSTLESLRATPRRAIGGSAVRLMQSAVQLAQLVRERDVQLMHAFSTESAEVGYLASRIARIPLVVTVMNCGPYPQVDRWVLRQCEKVIAISGAVESDLLDLGVSPERLERIFLGINHEQFDTAPSGRLRQELDIEAGSPLIGMVATLERKKAQDVLIRAMPRIMERFPDVNAVLVGGDHEGSDNCYGPYEAELRQLADSLGVDRNTHFLGFRPNAATLISDLDAAILCSRKEALGLAAVEALSSGVPLIASAVEGLLEVVEDGVTGLLVAPDSPDELAQRVNLLLSDPSLSARLARDGRRSVRQRFDAHTLALQNRAVYEQMLAPIRERDLARRVEGA